MGTKNLNEMAQIRLYFSGPKSWSESILWQRFCFGMVSTTSLSLSMRGRYENEKLNCRMEMATYFQNKRVRYARADALELYSVLCFLSIHFWTSSSLDVPAGVTQEEGHTGFLTHLLSEVRALIFLARRIQPFLSLVDREVEFFVLTI